MGSFLPAPESLSSGYWCLRPAESGDPPAGRTHGGGRWGGEKKTKQTSTTMSIPLITRIYQQNKEHQCPTSVDPVNATLSTSMCLTIAAPAVGPIPVKMFTTPSGKPTWRRKQGNLQQDTTSLGRRSQVQATEPESGRGLYVGVEEY